MAIKSISKPTCAIPHHVVYVFLLLPVLILRILQGKDVVCDIGCVLLGLTALVPELLDALLLDALLLVRLLPPILLPLGAL